MHFILLPFIILSALGLGLSLWSHVASVMNDPQPLGPWAWGLHIGIFAVWLPVVFVSRRMTEGCDRKDFWKFALRGCPAWMRWLTFGFFGYAFVNFALFMLAPREGKAVGKHRLFEDAPASVVRGFSGHWMAFYAAAFSTLYSAAVISIREGSVKMTPVDQADELDEQIA
jgi:hypothetical protein